MSSDGIGEVIRLVGPPVEVVDKDWDGLGPAVPHRDESGALLIPQDLFDSPLSAGCIGTLIKLAAGGGRASRESLYQSSGEARFVIDDWLQELWRAGYLADCGYTIRLRGVANGSN